MVWETQKGQVTALGKALGPDSREAYHLSIANEPAACDRTTNLSESLALKVK